MVMLWIDIIETTRRPRTSAPTSRTPIELLNNQKRLMFVSSLAVGRGIVVGWQLGQQQQRKREGTADRQIDMQYVTRKGEKNGERMIISNSSLKVADTDLLSRLCKRDQRRRRRVGIMEVDLLAVPHGNSKCRRSSWWSWLSQVGFCIEMARDINPFVVNFGKYLLIVVYSDRM